MKTIAALLLLAAFWYPAPLLATPPVIGTTQSRNSGGYMFFILHMKADTNAKPGVHFYAMVRIVFDDGTWADGGLTCSPVGLSNGEESWGGQVCWGPVHQTKPVKRVELVGSIGDPRKFFTPDQKATGFEPLNDATLKKLLASGGFVISLPVEAAVN